MKHSRLYSILIAFISFTLITGLNIWANQKKQVESQNVKKVPVSKLRAVAIQNVRIGTEADGRWFWKAQIKNIGGEAFPRNTLTIQGIQILQNNKEVGASGIRLPNNLAARTTVPLKLMWLRCCQSKQLRIEVWDEGVSPRKKMTSKTVAVPQINVKVGTLSYEYRTWKAVVRNLSNFAVKIGIQGHARPMMNVLPSESKYEPAGGFKRVIPANGVITQEMPSFKPSFELCKEYLNPITSVDHNRYEKACGFYLKVELRFYDSDGQCKGKGYCVVDSKVKALRW